ncbi:hypothetical protein V6N11_008804 [Hibiscus sabdariffa]|uniref:Uncharacterized protein n=1 Tax=Hibiscus sabdariffa TaxID=183260 RepID=A0ABR2NQN8_9ROSI
MVMGKKTLEKKIVVKHLDLVTRVLSKAKPTKIRRKSCCNTMACCGRITASDLKLLSDLIVSVISIFLMMAETDPVAKLSSGDWLDVPEVIML